MTKTTPNPINPAELVDRALAVIRADPQPTVRRRWLLPTRR